MCEYLPGGLGFAESQNSIAEVRVDFLVLPCLCAVGQDAMRVYLCLEFNHYARSGDAWRFVLETHKSVSNAAFPRFGFLTGCRVMTLRALSTVISYRSEACPATRKGDAIASLASDSATSASGLSLLTRSKASAVSQQQDETQNERGAGDLRTVWCQSNGKPYEVLAIEGEQ